MAESIRAFKASGLMSRERGDGFVFGVLSLQESSPGDGTKLPSIDLPANKRLVEEALPYGCVFHRAFDSILAAGTSVEDAVESLLTCGFDGVLTSGGPGNAVDNLPVFRGLVASAKGRLDILIGGGVRAENAGRILEAAGPGDRVWLHSSCLGKSRTDQVDEEEATALVRVMTDGLK
jgi:copper homeostasis protein